MKRIFFFTFLCFFIKTLSAEKPMVVSTATMIADITKNIGKDHINAECIVPIGGDPHLYKPVPNDAKKIFNADLVLKNGLTFEGWLDELIENSGTKATIFTVTEGVDVIKSLSYDTPDPHAWMNAKNGVVYAENIKKALQKLLPEHAEDFEQNFLAYKKEIEELDTYIEAEINKIPAEKRILITSHDAFQYYGKRYGIRLESVLGVSTDADIQTEDVIKLQKVIKETGVPALFVESTVSPKVLKQIAADNHIVIGGKLLSDSLGDKKQGGETYIKMMRQNTDVIVAALTSKTTAPTEVDSSGSGMTSYLMTGFIVLLFLGGLLFMFSKNR